MQWLVHRAGIIVVPVHAAPPFQFYEFLTSMYTRKKVKLKAISIEQIELL